MHLCQHAEVCIGTITEDQYARPRLGTNTHASTSSSRISSRIARTHTQSEMEFLGSRLFSRRYILADAYQNMVLRVSMLKAVQYLQHARPRLLSMSKVRRVGKSRSLKRGVPGSNQVRVCQQIK